MNFPAFRRNWIADEREFAGVLAGYHLECFTGSRDFTRLRACQDWVPFGSNMDDQTNAGMKAALRVLSAIAEKRTPDPKDEADLWKYVTTLIANTPIDEVACEVIEHALKVRAKAR